jgi:putative FmdB family regulatory protein
MPTYEYECQKCGHRFEEFQSMKDAPLSKCPKCRGKLKRLIGAGAGLLFKGSGFYTTDYRSSGYSEKKKSDSGATPPAPAGGSGEAAKPKPAGAKESKPAKEPRSPKKSGD